MRPRRGSRRFVRRLTVLCGILVVGAPILAPTNPVAGSDGVVEGRVRVSPLTVNLTLSADSALVGRTVKAEARISNIGSTTLQGLTAELRSDRVGLTVKAAIVDVASLKPGKSTTVAWSVCGRVSGSYVLLVRVTRAGSSIDSAARLLSVTPGGRKGCS